jgi:hypothetical protein
VAYEVRPRKDHRGVDLISDALPFGRLWYGEPNAISYANFFSRSHDAVIRVYDAVGNVIETTSTRAISKSEEFCSHRITLSAKTRFHKINQPRKTWPNKWRNRDEASHIVSRSSRRVGGRCGESAGAGRGKGGCETLHGGFRERSGSSAESALRSR